VVHAVVPSGAAVIATILDKAVIEPPPIFARHELHEVLLYAFRVMVIRQVEADGKATHVCINRNTFMRLEEYRKDNVCGLPTDARKRNEFRQRRRNLSLVARKDCPRRSANMTGLAPVEPAREDGSLKFALRRMRIIPHRLISLEKSFSNRIDTLIGALRRKYDRNEKLVRF
jgi:hypothetical protein